MVDDLIKRILDTSENNPAGFTLNLTTFETPQSGYSVAYQETQDSFGIDGLKKVIQHAKAHDNWIGGWSHNGKYYYDSVRIVQSRTEAIRLAKKYHQIAIWDFNNNEEIKIEY